MGVQGPVGMYTWFGIAAYISALVSPPYGRLAAEEQVLEGRFRTVTTRTGFLANVTFGGGGGGGCLGGGGGGGVGDCVYGR